MKNYKSAALSTVVSSAFLVFLTIYSELSESFKNFLKAITGHHWATKSVFGLILFFILYFLFRDMQTKEKEIWKYTKIVFWFTILFTLIIFLFFVLEFLSNI